MMWRHWVAASFFLGLSQGVFHPAVLRAQGILREVPFDRKLVASTGVASDRFGAKLAISGDTLVASAPNATVDGKLFAGAAYVFMRDSGIWPVGGAQAPDRPGRDRFRPSASTSRSTATRSCSVPPAPGPAASSNKASLTCSNATRAASTTGGKSPS